MKLKTEIKSSKPTDTNWLKRFKASMRALSFSSAWASASFAACSASTALSSAAFRLDLSSSTFLCCAADGRPESEGDKDLLGQKV